MSATATTCEAGGVSVAAAAGIDESCVVEIGVIETRFVGVGEAGAEGVENCAGAVRSCAVMLNNDCAVSEAACAMVDESSGYFGLAVVGSGEFAGVLAALKLAERTS